MPSLTAAAARRIAMASRSYSSSAIRLFSDTLQHVPEAVRVFIAHQLQLLWDHTAAYPWQSRSHDTHLALIRQHLDWRFPTAQDKQDLERWLQTVTGPEAPTEADLSESAYTRLRALRIELPTERELQRLVRTALWGFFHAIYTNVTAQLSEPVRTALDQLLVIAPEASQSIFAAESGACRARSQKSPRRTGEAPGAPGPWCPS